MESYAKNDNDKTKRLVAMMSVKKKRVHLISSESGNESADQETTAPLETQINNKSCGSNGADARSTSLIKSRALPLANSFSDGFQDLLKSADSPRDMGSMTSDLKCVRESRFEDLFDIQNVRSKKRQSEIPAVKLRAGVPRKRKLERYSTVTGAGASNFSFVNSQQPAKRTNSMPSFTELRSSVSQNLNSRLSQEKANKGNLLSDVDDDVLVPWVEKHAPRSTAEVALHNRKLADTRQALTDMLKPQAATRLLILSGPAGASKSTIVRMLARELLSTVKGDEYNYEPELLEWENPDSLPGRSLPMAFQDFLSSARYRSNKDTIVMIDDLPMLSHGATKEFFNTALLNWVNQPADDYVDSQCPGLVLIMTEVEVSSAGTIDEGSSYSFRNADSLVTERVLWPQLLRHPAVRRLKFNPISKTLLVKTLKTVIEHEPTAFRRLSSTDRNRAVDMLSAGGDVRSAITALEYWAVGRTRALAAASADRRLNVEARDEDVYLTMLRRDAHLDLFHAVGKVIHRSAKDKLGQNSASDDDIVADIVADWNSSRGDQQILSGTIFENYLNTSGHLPIEAIGESLESLCVSDLLTGRTQNYGGAGNLLLTQLACELDVRGVRHTMKVHEHLKPTIGSGSCRRPNTIRFTSLFKRRSEAVIEYESAICRFHDEHPRSSAESIMIYEKYYTDYIMTATEKSRLTQFYSERGAEVGKTTSFPTVGTKFETDHTKAKLGTVLNRKSVSFSVVSDFYKNSVFVPAVTVNSKPSSSSNNDISVSIPSVSTVMTNTTAEIPIDDESDWGSEFATDNEFDREVKALASKHRAQQQAQDPSEDQLASTKTKTKTDVAITSNTQTLGTTTTPMDRKKLSDFENKDFDLDDDDLDEFFNDSF